MKSNLGTLRGEVVKSTSFGGLTLTETAYQAKMSLPVHAHPSDYFCFVLQGDFTEFSVKKSCVCSPGTLIFNPAGETHADDFHAPARCFDIQPDASWLGRIRQNSSVLDYPLALQDGFIARLVLRLYKEFRHLDELSALVIEGLTLEILSETARRSIKSSSKPPPCWLVKARELLHEQFYESFSLSQIAETVGVHETHLSREFRRYYGSTLGEYVRERRIEFACHRLLRSNDSLSEIAHAAGFFDQSHFGKIFKQITGASPAAHRKMFRVR